MTSSRHVVFRADSSTAMGSGHVMRCLTLADALARQGYGVSFICRELPGSITAVIEGRGYAVHSLRGQERRDAEETAAILKTLPRPADLLVVDHYGIDEKWQKDVRKLVGKLLVIDDLADRRHDCDFLLDQNASDPPKNYRDLVPENCTLLLGAGYALLRPEFARLRRDLRPRGVIRRILVFFGGGDPGNETGKALEAIATVGADLAVDVVVGAANPNRDSIAVLCRQLAGATLHRQTDDMARLVADADLAIGGCGSATWERCCLGLPTICTTLAANQEPIAAAAAAAGAVLYLGKAEDVGGQDIAKALHELLASPETVARMSEQAARLVDGYGTERVIKALGLAGYKITIVSDAESWINAYIPELTTVLKQRGHTVRWLHKAADIAAGDAVFLLGCGELVAPAILQRNRHNLVVHESALPAGKGWSPLTWQILEGKNTIPITLCEAAAAVDSGAIYLQDNIVLDGTELIDEIRRQQARATIRLCLEFIDNYPDIILKGRPQAGAPSYYRRRTPADSELDPNAAIAAQFNLLRVVDNDRYPAYFRLNGARYILRIERADD